jgi:PAS domain S-box-containing protein
MRQNLGPVEWRAWTTLEPEIRTALGGRLNRALAERAFSGSMVYFVVVVVLAFSTPFYADHPALLIAVGAAELLAGGTRLLAARQVTREGAHPEAERVLRIATYGSFGVWGAFCAWTIHLYGGEWTSMLLLLCTSSLAGGATSSLAPDLPMAMRCLGILAVPTIVSALARGDVRHVALAVLAGIYAAFLVLQTKRNWAAFWEASVAAEREKIRGSQERQRAERERASLVAAIEQSAEEILITDGTGNIVYCNASFERLSGYTRKDVAGRNLRFLKDGGSGEAGEGGAEQEVAEALRTGGAWSGQLVNQARDGQVYHVEGMLSPIHGAFGKLDGFAWAAHDVTERLRMEDRLRQAQKMESIGRLAGGVAHDFNNLLTVIRGYAGMLESELADESLQDYSATITKAADQGAALTKQLLTFSRKQLIKPTPVALNELVNDVRSMLQRLLGEDIEVRTELEAEVGLIRADPDQMSQILMNLAANARDAMPQGGLFTVRTTRCEFDGPGVSLTVSDTGTGISPELQEHIFEPFFTTKERGRGTGLGLSMVYGIVAQNGGRIEVQSEQGQGTAFTIQFPQVEGELPVARPAASAVSRASGSETVLVVEDHDDLRALVVGALRGAGFRVLAAANGPEATVIAERESEPIHLLLTDVIMPLMNGKALADQLSQKRPGMKVLFISGYSGDLIAQHGVLDPKVAYLAKPFSREALMAKVRSVLG